MALDEYMTWSLADDHSASCLMLLNWSWGTEVGTRDKESSEECIQQFRGQHPTHRHNRNEFYQE